MIALTKALFALSFLLSLQMIVAFPCRAETGSQTMPIELQALKASIGVWDAEVEVWPEGPDSPSITFKGVETNRPYGEHWIASDFDSEYAGETTRVHSIVGYDLDRGKLVGKVIDHGPYAAQLVGEFDSDSKTVHWTTEVKDTDGKPIVHKTSVTQKSADERVLLLCIPSEEDNSLIKCMEIKFVRRK